MIENHILEQLITFSECKTLSKTAELLLISQPALTRSMKKLEQELGVSIFERKKNQLTLNDTGKVAVEYAKRVLQAEQDLRRQVIAFDRSLHTISIGYCAPIPQRMLTPLINNTFSGMTISADMKSDEDFLEKLDNHSYELVVIHKKPSDKYIYKEIGTEHLSLNISISDPMAFYPEIHLSDLRGKSILLLNDIGFWMDVVKEYDMNLIVQYEQNSFNEIMRSSTLPYFSSNHFQENTNGRINVPIVDKSCHVTYYLVCLKENQQRFEPLFQ